jgi:Domain of unknown function (DUF4345)
MPTTLRAGLCAGGLVATVAGLHTAITGARSLPRKQRANAAIESELRFYGTFYAAYGIALLRAAARADTEPAAVRPLAGTLFAAGLARAGGWLAAGRPHPGQRALLALELALPPLAVAAQERSARHQGPPRTKSANAAGSPPGAPGE